MRASPNQHCSLKLPILLAFLHLACCIVLLGLFYPDPSAASACLCMLSLLSDTSTSTTSTKAIESVLIPHPTSPAWQRLDVCPQQHSFAEYWNLDFLEKGPPPNPCPALLCGPALCSASDCRSHTLRSAYHHPPVVRKPSISLTRPSIPSGAYANLCACPDPAQVLAGAVQTAGAHCLPRPYRCPQRAYGTLLSPLQSPSAVPPQPPGPAHERAWPRRRTRSQSPLPNALQCNQ